VKEIKDYIRDIPDFPKPGILFKDITPLLADAEALRGVVDRIADTFRGRIDMVLGIESRGFIIGAPVAYALGTGLAVGRKPGKLPASTFSAQYALEYGNDTLEIHRDAFGHPRCARHRWHRRRRHRAGQPARWRSGRLRLRHRAGLPARPRAPATAPRVFAGRICRLNAPRVRHDLERGTWSAEHAPFG